MNNLQRINFQIVIGIDQSTCSDSLSQAWEMLDDKLTRIAGGIIRTNGTGTWTPGSEFNDFFGPLERDGIVMYSVIVMPDQAENFYNSMKAIISEVANKFRLPINYVHVTSSLAIAKHFSLRELKESSFG